MLFWWLFEIVFPATLHFISIEIPDDAQINDELYIFSNFFNFEKDVHNVDLGNSYLTDTSCWEMLHFLSKSIIKNDIRKLLNDETICYYSVHNDDSSSAKTMDEKELPIIETAYKGEVKFSVMSLKVPEEANNEGLKLILEISILKLGLNTERKKQRDIFVSFLHS